MTTEKTKKASRSKKRAGPGTRSARPRKAKADGKLSALEAAAKVLAETHQPMTTKEMIEAMASKGYWKSPHGLTPQATLYSAILREVNAKGQDARFLKAERGKFALKT